VIRFFYLRGVGNFERPHQPLRGSPTMIRESDGSTGSIAFVSIVLALVALAAVTGSAVAASPAENAPANETATPTPNASGGFGEYTAVMNPDEASEVTVTLTGTDEARILIGGPNTDYDATVDVTDGNGDGTVVIEFTPASAGGDGTPFGVADDADSVEVVNATALDDPGLSSANLPAVLVVDGSETDQMTWMVRQPMDRGSTSTTEASSQEPSPTPTTTEAGEEPSTETTTESEDPTTESSGGSGPGFGVAAAVVALLAVALFARTR